MTTYSFPLPGEKEKAEQALLKLPLKVRGFFVPQYQILGALPEGTFVGLYCKCCRNWQDCGHETDCPVRLIVAEETAMPEITEHTYATCPQCGEKFILIFDADFGEKTTLHIRSCPSGGVYDVSVECPKCGLVENL